MHECRAGSRFQQIAYHGVGAAWAGLYRVPDDQPCREGAGPPYYEQGSAASVDYIVSVSVGDEVRTYTGSFTASDVGETQDVMTFTY